MTKEDCQVIIPQVFGLIRFNEFLTQIYADCTDSIRSICVFCVLKKTLMKISPAFLLFVSVMCISYSYFTNSAFIISSNLPAVSS
jgi:hypothetical protein